MLDNKEKFKYTVEYQWDLLRYIVQDKNGERALNKIEDDYFTLVEHQVIAYAMKSFYKKERRIPGETILRETIYILLNTKQYINLVTKDEQKQILSLIKTLYTQVVKDGDKIYELCKDFKIYTVIKNVIENVDINDQSKYKNFSRQIELSLIDEDEKDDLKSAFLLDSLKERQFKRQDKKTVYPTPFKQLNKLTNAGGYERHSILVILDKQKKGKTTMLSNTARGYLKMKKKVLIVDLENGSDNIFSRLEQSIMGLSKMELLSGEHDVSVQKRFRKYKRLGGEIVVIRLPALVTTCNDIQAKMDTLYRMNGFKPDVLILDYAAKLGSISRKDDDRSRISDIYLDLDNLAVKNDIEHIWTANHVTREGAKSRMATRYQGEDIALCIDITRHAQAIFGLNRNNAEIEAGYFRLEIVEQRDGKPNGRAVFTVDMETQRANELSTHERIEYDELFDSLHNEDHDEKAVKKERKTDYADK